MGAASMSRHATPTYLRVNSRITCEESTEAGGILMYRADDLRLHQAHAVADLRGQRANAQPERRLDYCSMNSLDHLRN